MMRWLKSKTTNQIMVEPSGPHVTNPNNSPFMRLIELMHGLISHFDEYVGYDLHPYGADTADWVCIMYRDTNEQLIAVDVYPDTVHLHIYRIAKELDNLEIISRRDFVAIDMEIKKLMALTDAKKKTA